jgi:hypothetical protein
VRSTSSKLKVCLSQRWQMPIGIKENILRGCFMLLKVLLILALQSTNGQIIPKKTIEQSVNW